ncbi:ABC transporter permease [Pseudoxanthomonas mexicana]|uniref:ABC transporter permease n=1 Tax=Pseudoxanthomonas mexicana TaxID=128785 RepID=UPI0028AC5417|nr:ABC transporter permease [Pseudoxanthomonas mexicana]
MSRSLLGDLRESVRHHEFWTYSSWLDIAIRYRRTKLGLSWLLLAFMFFVIVMGAKYAYLMGVDPRAFIPYLAVGFMVWRFLVSILNDAAVTYSRHSSYIMDGRARLTDYLLRSVASASFNMVFAVLVVAGVLVWSDLMHVINLFSLLLTFPILVINVMWISVCVSLVGARFRDAQELISTILMAGFLLTPIIWDVSKFPPDTTRGFITRLNPAFHLVEVVRAPVLGQVPEHTSMVFVMVMALLGWVLAAWMYRRYAKFVPLWVV